MIKRQENRSIGENRAIFLYISPKELRGKITQTGDVLWGETLYNYRCKGAAARPCRRTGGGFTRRVIVDMQNTLFADAIARALRDFDSDFDVCCSESPEKTPELCDYTMAQVLIMEVTNYTPWRFEERMRLRDTVKLRHPDCKIVLVVDENTEKKLAEKVRLAKKDGLIENFLYGSVSATYLAAVVDTL